MYSFEIDGGTLTETRELKKKDGSTFAYLAKIAVGDCAAEVMISPEMWSTCRGQEGSRVIVAGRMVNNYRNEIQPNADTLRVIDELEWMKAEVAKLEQRNKKGAA